MRIIVRLVVLVLVAALLVDCDCLLGGSKKESEGEGCGGYAAYDNDPTLLDGDDGQDPDTNGGDGLSACLLVDEAGACRCVGGCGPARLSARWTSAPARTPAAGRT